VKDTIHFFKRRYDIDLQAEYERLEAVGKIPVNQLRDRDTLLEHLNDCQENERKAKTMRIKAKGMYERHMVGYHKEMRALKRKALVRLEAWKKKVDVKKQTTEEMVVEAICEQDDTRELYEKLLAARREVKDILDACEALAKAWEGRRFTLHDQVSLLKAPVEVNLGGKRRKSPRRS